MKLTSEQASALATVDSIGSDIPLELHDGMMRFHGHEPTEPVPYIAALLGRSRVWEGDPVATRLARLKRASAGRIVKVADYFVERRDGIQSKAAHDEAVIDLLGVKPRDLAGQCVLMAALNNGAPRPLLADLADAFSVRLVDLGKRLVAGELIGIADPELMKIALLAREHY